MDFKITKEYVWVGAIPDKSGAMAERLRALHEGGLDLEFILGQRDWSGSGMLFVSPLRTEEEIEVAQRAGLPIRDSFLALRVDAPNVPGIAARMATALAEAGLNLRGYTAAAFGERCVTSIAFDNRDDVDKGMETLERLLSSD